MESKSYKSYRECPICKQTLPLTRDYFMRYGDNTGYHKVCRECEQKLSIEKEWKDGLLLCHNCLQYKDEDEFTSNGSHNRLRNFRRYICKECTTDRQRKHDVNLPRSQKLQKGLRLRLLGAKDRATKQSLPFNLTIEYIQKLWDEQQGRCAISGLPMTFELKGGRIHSNVSIDKINRLQGYVTGNVQLVCMACNQIKSDMTDNEMYNFCKSIVKYYENKNNIHA